MKLIRTIKLKLDADSQAFKPTVEAFTKAFNHVCQIGWHDKDYNGVSLHQKTYSATRTYLPAQLACSARMKATEALKGTATAIKKRNKRLKDLEQKRIKYPNRFYKTPKEISCPQSKQSSIRYDARSYNIWFDRNEISLLTVDGRKKFKIDVPEYFKQYLHWRRCSADLFIRSNGIFLNIVFENDIPDAINNNNYVGIDRGIKNLVVTSDNQFYGGSHVKQIHRKYDRLRSKLRSVLDKGKKSKRGVKRHLAKISHKANRFMTDYNHCLSKQIIASIPVGSTLVLEDLKGIRERVQHKKEQRRDFHRWSFYQLEQFLIYKAAAKGIAVAYVDARYTSLKCSKCGHIERGNRVIQSCFECKKCGFQLNADLNASRNIRFNYLDAIRALGSRKCHPSRALVIEPGAPGSSVEQAVIL